MPLSWNEIKSRAQTFIKDWEHGGREEADAKQSMHILRLTIFFSVVCFFCACSKSGSASIAENTKDTTASVITIISPTNNQAFSSGQTIQVSASATDNVKITQMHIHVLNKTSGASLRDIHAHPGAPSGTIQDTFTAQAGITYTIKIMVFDASQNLATAQVEVVAN